MPMFIPRVSGTDCESGNAQQFLQRCTGSAGGTSDQDRRNHRPPLQQTAFTRRRIEVKSPTSHVHTSNRPHVCWQAALMQSRAVGSLVCAGEVEHDDTGHDQTDAGGLGDGQRLSQKERGHRDDGHGSHPGLQRIGDTDRDPAHHLCQ